MKENTASFQNTIYIDTDGTVDFESLDTLECYLQKLLTALGRKDWEVSVMVCDSAYMSQLNEQYRGKTGPTDVLSFPQADTANDIPHHEVFVAGDIVICPQQVFANAQEFKVSHDEELRRVCVHGILHLSGFDHQTNEAEEPMLIEQERLLRLLEEEKLHIL